ncbi:MAG: hypothetical protein OI74_09450 [Gammaproteobacteria bacterium (ex Lamellibrachia satsuma)]|nr:MAG: hypothetical protein HPY30_17020 [Gammaproteobacteria bacterium (ex Lamellibrachia satsuma)]RRS32989.1 MAG: hypothetical protein OI74_09450 [Gammaproteobacteria bacterium (ex Lamellibrachia satsuma)]RRS36626.1 MAG: hypothetical protein NV67_05970 [Gammaproteobacteria bacterium (ex Lamellibrachia satsuma)]
MSQHLPDQFDPWRFADLGNQISGRFPLADLPRLRACLMDAEGEVAFDLVFQRDERRRACVQGDLRASLKLECQRCLGPMVLPVDAEISLAFVEGQDEAEALPEQLDPHLVEDGRVKLRDLVEDDLLLALPQVARHSEGDCTMQSADEPSLDPESESGKAERENPFAMLAELKRDHD